MPQNKNRDSRTGRDLTLEHFTKHPWSHACAGCFGTWCPFPRAPHKSGLRAGNEGTRQMQQLGFASAHFVIPGLLAPLAARGTHACSRPRAFEPSVSSCFLRGFALQSCPLPAAVSYPPPREWRTLLSWSIEGHHQLQVPGLVS